MFEIRATTVIQLLVESMLKRDMYELVHGGQIKKPGMLFNIIFRTSSYETKKSLMKRVLIIFCGDTSVFYTILEDTKMPQDLNSYTWINSSNHDSCWMSDGLDWIDQLYFDQCKEVDPSRPPMMCDSGAIFGTNKLFTNVMVTSKSDPGNDYKRIITNIELCSKED